MIRDEDARKIAEYLSDEIDERVSHLYLSKLRQYIRTILDKVDEESKMQRCTARQSILLHPAALFDVNECSLDWFPKQNYILEYESLLITEIGRELPKLLGDEFEEEGQAIWDQLSVCEK